MPYIDKSIRPRAETSPMTAGELNYAITKLLIKYQANRKLTYQTINDIIGALEGAKQEYYRRVATIYENQKIDENGDVY